MEWAVAALVVWYVWSQQQIKDHYNYLSCFYLKAKDITFGGSKR